MRSRFRDCSTLRTCSCSVVVFGADKLTAQYYRALSRELRGAFSKLTPGLRGTDFRERYGEGVADAIGVVVERDLGFVQGGDFAHDGEAQPAAVGVAAEQPVEALEHALALLDRDARPVVADRHAGPGMR